jgi:hypothetical protein
MDLQHFFIRRRRRLPRCGTCTQITCKLSAPLEEMLDVHQVTSKNSRVKETQSKEGYEKNSGKILGPSSLFHIITAITRDGAGRRSVWLRLTYRLPDQRKQLMGC